MFFRHKDVKAKGVIKVLIQRQQVIAITTIIYTSHAESILRTYARKGFVFSAKGLHGSKHAAGASH
jgi:hypothetical protein